MKLKFSIAAAVLSISVLTAQKTIHIPEKPDARNSILKGIEKYEEGEYDKALGYFRQVKQGDTAYATAVYEQALTLMVMEKFEESLALLEVVDSMGGVSELQVKDMQGSVLDYMERSEEALEIYNAQLEKYPTSHLLWYNKGVTLMGLKRYEEAEKALQKAIEISPLHVNSHISLGRLNILTGRHSKALMSSLFGIYFCMDPTRANNMVATLESAMQLQDVKDDETKISDEFKQSGGDFSQADAVIETGVALGSRYKVKSKLKAGITRQLQIFFENFTYNENDAGWYMQFYGPVFAYVQKNKLSDPLVYFGLKFQESPDIQATAYKLIGKAAKISDFAATHIRENYNTLEYTYNGETKTYRKEYYESGALQTLLICKDKDCKVVDGNIFLFYSSGALKEVIPYVNGKKQGLAYGFYDDGTPEYVQGFKDDLLHGIGEYYDESGYKYLDYEYTNGEATGVVRRYNSAGTMIYESANKAGKAEGPYKRYYDNGQMSEEGTYKADQQSGTHKVYYPDGQLKFKGSLVADEYEGDAEFYYPDGTLSSKGAYKAGDQVGNWVEYHQNGKVSKEYSYTDKGIQTGVWKEYFENGNIKNEETYGISGKKTGKSIHYDIDGIKHFEYVFNESVIKSITIYNKKGEVVESQSESKGKLAFTFYTANGYKLYTGQFKGEDRDGEWTYFYPTGAKSSVSNYKNGLLSGKYTEYYATGKQKSSFSYKEGDPDGYAVTYHSNGAIKSHGWYVNGDRGGVWSYYFPDSTLELTEYYINGEVNGRSPEYGPNGKVYCETVYDQGIYNGRIYFDTTGAIVHAALLENGNGTLEVRNLDSVLISSTNYIGGEVSDTLAYYFPNGQLQYSCNYLLGERNGTANWYYPDGLLSETCTYVYGKRQGDDKEYGFNGKMSYYSKGQRDELVDSSEVYHENGSVYIRKRYMDGQVHGKAEWFAPDGSLILAFFYDYGDIVGYSYLDKSGNLVPMIAIGTDSMSITTYYKSGKKSAEVGFWGGDYHGKTIVYYPDGSKMEEENYRYDELHGEQKYYRAGNKMSKSINYADGYAHGTATEYYENGKMRSTTEYWMGEEHGISRGYTNTGKPKWAFEYYMGLPRNINE